MNLLSQKFGATGSIQVDLEVTGLKIQASESDVITDESANVTLHPDLVIDGLVKILGGGSWVSGMGDMLKKELAALAAPKAP